MLREYAVRLVWTLRWFAASNGFLNLRTAWRVSGIYVEDMRRAGFKSLT